MEFTSLKFLQQYTDKHGRFEKGETVKITDTNEYYVYDGSNWNKTELTSNLNMNLYALNKQLISQFKPYSESQWDEAIVKINNWAKDIETSYFMLLCKDISYYTVFTKEFDYPECSSLGAAVKECLEYTGEVVFIDFDNTDHIEIWLKQEDNDNCEIYCLMLFNYELGVVTYRG